MKRNGTMPLIGLVLGLSSALMAMSAQAGRTLTGDELSSFSTRVFLYGACCRSGFHSAQYPLVVNLR